MPSTTTFNIVEPIDTRQGALFQHIHNALIIALQNESDILADLAALPVPGNCVQEYLHLQKEFAGQTLAKDLIGMYCIYHQYVIAN